MGSGKTTICKKLARKLSMEWVDLDLEIEKEQKQSVQDIFDKNGELFFRHLEHQMLQQIIKKNNLVIACGGGTPCFYDAMSLMNSHGITIYLKHTPESLYSRLVQSKSGRPLLKNRNEETLLNYIKETLFDREPTYLKAKIIQKGLKINLNDLENQIIALSLNLEQNF